MRDPLFQNAAICIHEDDAAYLGPESFEMHCASFTAVGGSAEYIESRWEAGPGADMPAATRLLRDGERVGPFTVLHCPGHSRGSVSLYDSSAACLFSGDTLFAGGLGRTDLPGGDAGALRQSLRRLFTLPPATRCFPGHGATTTLGAEKNRSF
jgi:glyoxylase-like metal-dependent hydrolase (beta-lactamase superfamily II)